MTDLFSAYPRLLAAIDEGAAAPAGDATSPLSPLVILVLCVIAGISTALLLPGRRESAAGRLGGAGLAAAGLVLGGLLMRWTIDLGGMSVYFWAFSAIALFGSVRVITHTKPVYSALYFVLTVFATAGLFVLLWAEFMAAAIVLIYAGAILITYVFVIMLASEAVSAGAGKPEDNPLSEHDALSRSPLAASIVGFAVAGMLLFLVIDKGADFARDGAPGARATGAPVASSPVHSAGAAEAGLVEAKISSVKLPDPSVPSPDAIAELGSTQALGQELIENHAINLQLAAVILTLAMVGAITLARRRVGILAPHHGWTRTGVTDTGSRPETVHTPNTPVDDNPHSIPVYGTSNPQHKAYPEN
ncbi:MAG TPA: NADH-quinone oxidoreductase subunit J [Tepidisphaeraceae bacterium]|jgi:NADH-quinone oxidoreductase subunit J